MSMLYSFFESINLSGLLMFIDAEFSQFLLSVVDTVAESDDSKEEYSIPFLKQNWINSAKILKLIVRFSVNFFFLFVLVRLIYYPAEKRKDFLFTYFTIGITVFTLCFTLDSIKIDLAFALGLFAIFGIIRYRTDAIPIKEMTYLFLVIGLAVMNALINKKISIAEMIFANGIIVTTTFAIERLWLMRHEIQKKVLYDRIDLLQKGKRAELIADLTDRTGIEINRIDVGRFDLLRDTVQIIIYYYEDQQELHVDNTNLAKLYRVVGKWKKLIFSLVKKNK